MGEKIIKKRIWVTGGAGFIGSHLTCQLIKQGHQVIVVDNFSSGKKSNLENLPVEILEVDIRDEKQLAYSFDLFLPDTIYHLAGISSVAECHKNPKETSEVNYIAGKKLLTLAIEKGVKRFIFSSSAAVYGEQNLSLGESIKETNKLHPLSNYGKDKLALEEAVLESGKTKKIATTAFRFFNVYGENQDPNSPYSGVLSIFLQKLRLQEIPNLTIFGTGEQCRDFIHVSDIVKALLLPLSEEAMNGEVYNVGTGSAYSLNQIIHILEKISHKKIERNFLPTREGDIFYSLADITKLKSVGFNSETTLELGLTQLYESLLREGRPLISTSLVSEEITPQQ